LYIKEISAKIAEIRGEDFDIVSKALVDNARKMFGI
jgi:Tat protein secretion system quality control protein TatD with DNase activity